MSIRNVWREYGKTISIVLAVVFIVWGASLRLWDLGEQSLWIDEGYTINGTQAAIDNGYPRLDSGAVYTNGWAYLYAAAGSIKSFGLDPFYPWSARLPAAVFGIALVAFLTFFARRLFKDEPIIWLSVSFLASFSFWAIAWSRQARGYTAAAFLVLISFYLLYRYYESGKLRLAVAAWIAYALAMLSHFSAGILLPSLIALSILGYIASLKKHTAFLPHSLKTRPVTILLCVMAVLFAVSIPLGLDLHNNIVGYLAFFALYPNISTTFWGALIASAILYYDKKRRVALFFIAAPFVSGLITLFFYGDKVAYRYLFTLLPFSLVLFPYVVSRLCEMTPKLSRYKNAGVLISIVFVASFSLSFVHKDFYKLEFGAPQPDFESAFRYIKENIRSGDMVISSYAHLHKLYLDQKGVWIATGHSKFESAEERMVNGSDYYVGAPVILDPDAFRDFVGNNHGFAIFDGRGRPRQADYFYVLNNKGYEKKTFKSEGGQDIWVFKF
jgi:hypothetical protein